MEGTNYPKLKAAILLCLLLLGIQIAAGMVLGIITGLLGMRSDSLFYGAGVILINLLSFGLVIFLGFKRTHKKFNEVFMFNNVPLKYWVSIIVFMFGFVIVSSELDNILQYFLPMPSFFQDVFESMLVNEYIIVSILLVGIIPAFVEEMLFRGVILNGFRGNYSRRKAIILSSVLFGAIHLNPWQFVTAFIIGIISAWICIKTESIILSIYIHLFNNVLSVFSMKYKDIMPVNGFNTAFSEFPEQTFQPLWFDIIGVVLIAAGMVLFLDTVKKSKNGT